MSGKRKTTPSYRFHRQSGRGIVTVRDHLGNRRDFILPGLFDSRESRREYKRIVEQLHDNDGKLPVPKSEADELTIAEFILRYIEEHVTTYYVDPSTGRPTSEQDVITIALRPLSRLYGDILVKEFDCVKLDHVREVMITGSWRSDEKRDALVEKGRDLGYARKSINKHMHRIRGMFRWGVLQKLVDPTVLASLQAVQPLRRGRSAARETEDVTPVPIEIVEKTLPNLPPVIADMVQVQMFTGARPGEICSMQVRQLDMTGEVWVYRPETHKNQWRGHERIIAIGPRAQEIIRQHLKPSLDAFIFDPGEQAKIINIEKRAKRKSKVQPSQVDRSKAKPMTQPGERFLVTSYNRAVRRACQREQIEPWHVHRLRHLAAQTVERSHGLEGARALLGHKTVDMSAAYAGRDLERAKQIAAKIG